MALSYGAEGMVAIKRIQEYLLMDEDDDYFNTDINEEIQKSSKFKLNDTLKYKIDIPQISDQLLNRNTKPYAYNAICQWLIGNKILSPKY